MMVLIVAIIILSLYTAGVLGHDVLQSSGLNFTSPTVYPSRKWPFLCRALLPTGFCIACQQKGGR